MTKETKQRVVSAVIMVCFVALCFYLGSSFSQVIVFMLGVLIVDELILNFFKLTRKSLVYLSVLLNYFFLVLLFYTVDRTIHFYYFLHLLGIIFNIFFTAFLVWGTPSRYFRPSVKLRNFIMPALPVIIGTYFIILSSIMEMDNWQFYFSALLVTNFSVDIGAWFFGKRFGKTKLWPEVSPKKTVEGYIGGVFTSIFLTALVWWSFHGIPSDTLLIIGIVFISIVSQIGDLIQSKLKRTFKIKDSSQLIPGHGGVFDRIDSLLYVAPFYAWLMFNFIR